MFYELDVQVVVENDPGVVEEQDYIIFQSS